MALPIGIELTSLKNYGGIKFDLEDHAMELIQEAVFKSGQDLYETFNNDENPELNDTYEFVIREMVEAALIAMETVQKETLEKYRDELLKAIYIARFDE